MSETLLKIEHICKKFPGVRALSDVSLHVSTDQIHALLGENGAGKSTLVRILTGAFRPDGGTMQLGGKPYSPASPHEAMAAGVRVVHQELNLFPHLSVAENIFIDRLPTRGPLLDTRRLAAAARDLLARVGLDVDPATPVEYLGVAQMQLVEIAHALSERCRLLILDEPTASLSSQDANRLFDILRDLRRQGLTTIFISHHLNEVFQIADHMSILRNGELVTDCPVAGMTMPRIVAAMVGRRMDAEYPFDEKITPSDEPLLEVSNLRFRGNRHSLSFSLRKGEILGIAGLVGSKRTETMRALFGADPKESGDVRLDGRSVEIGSPADAVAAGLSLLTEDRKGQGLVLDMNLASNVSLASLEKVSRRGLMVFGRERAVAQNYIEALGVRTPSAEQLARNLSGGNQQKIVLAKWLFRDARVLIFDEPTRGIDVGAKYEIYTLLWKLLAEGKGVLLVSSDLPELMGICHRILVFSDGQITGEFLRPRFDQTRILECAYANYINVHATPTTSEVIS